jgi:hypothetical protein
VFDSHSNSASMTAVTSASSFATISVSSTSSFAAISTAEAALKGHRPSHALDQMEGAGQWVGPSSMDTGTQRE